MVQDLEIVSTLSSAEREEVKKILIEMSEKGKSTELEDLYYKDYEEIPVDIWTFLSSPNYLGKFTNNGRDIFEAWKKELLYLHNPTTHIEEWAITGSIRNRKDKGCCI